MRVFIEYSKADYAKLESHLAGKGGLPSVVLRGVMKLSKEGHVKRCKGKCGKVRRQYPVPAACVESLVALADNEGISVAHLVQKRIIYPLLSDTLEQPMA